MNLNTPKYICRTKYYLNMLRKHCSKLFTNMNKTLVGCYVLINLTTYQREFKLPDGN